MCTGIEIAALATSLAGTGASVAASSQEQAAMNDKVKAELLRQKGFQRKATAAYDQSLGQSTPTSVNKQIGEGTQQALNEYSKVNAVPLSSSTSVSPVPAQNQQVQSQRNQAYTGLLGQRNAANQGYGTMSLDQYLKDLQAGSQLGTLSQEAQRSQAVLPYELQQAQNSWSGLSGLGTGLSALGGVLGVAGGIGAGARAAAAPAQFGAADIAPITVGGYSAPAAAQGLGSLGSSFGWNPYWSNLLGMTSLGLNKPFGQDQQQSFY